MTPITTRPGGRRIGPFNPEGPAPHGEPAPAVGAAVPPLAPPAAPPASAAPASEPPLPPGALDQEWMKIHVVVNAKGKVCILHDKKFEGTPIWVRFHKLYRRIEMIFDNGISKIIDIEINEEVNKQILNSTRVLMIRLENMVPIEGYDVILLIE